MFITFHIPNIAGLKEKYIIWKLWKLFYLVTNRESSPIIGLDRP
jgi:hypothetical protein